MILDIAERGGKQGPSYPSDEDLSLGTPAGTKGTSQSGDETCCWELRHWTRGCGARDFFATNRGGGFWSDAHRASEPIYFWGVAGAAGPIRLAKSGGGVSSAAEPVTSASQPSSAPWNFAYLALQYATMLVVSCGMVAL